MGICTCTTRNSLEEQILTSLKSLQIYNISFKQLLKWVLQSNDSNKRLNRQQSINLQLLDIDPKMIIRRDEFFLKVNQHFIPSKTTTDHFTLKYQLEYFKLIIEKSNQMRPYVLFFLFSLSKADSQSIENFWLLLKKLDNKQDIKYHEFKEYLLDYYKFNIQIPVSLIKNISEDKSLIEEAQMVLDSVVTTKNIRNFIDIHIVREFEDKLYSIKDSNHKKVSSHIVTYTDLFFIFSNKIEMLTDFEKMRGTFLKLFY